MQVNNQTWALALIFKFYAIGVRHFCVAPGSRSAPLAIALFNAQKHLKHQKQISSDKSSSGLTLPELTLHTHFDERGLGFFALNLAKASQTPVVILTTSGTAVANLHPSVIEAYETECPLIVLSADRPDRLLDCGANQAIQQKHLFGQNVCAFHNFQLPQNQIDLMQQLDTIATLFYRTIGPVHLNCQFDEPLYDAVVQADVNAIAALVGEHSTRFEYTSLDCTSSKEHLNDDSGLSQLVEAIARSQRCLVVVGSLTQKQKKTLRYWFRNTRSPIVADINSQIKFDGSQAIVRYFDLMLANTAGQTLLTPDLIVQIGGRIVSKRVNALLECSNAKTFLIQETDKNIDPTRKAVRVVISFDEFSKTIEPSTLANENLSRIIELNSRIDILLQRYFLKVWSEAGVCRALLAAIPAAARVFCGNSLAIRMLDSFSGEAEPTLSFYSNRGASGIDGLIASAAGVGAFDRGSEEAGNGHVFLFIGDTSFLHDMNSLALVAKSATPIKIIVLNNNGGAIFKMLPAAQESSYQALFQMPHGLSFAASAKQFGLNYMCCANQNQFQNNLAHIVSSPLSLIVECRLDGDAGVENIKVLLNQLGTASDLFQCS